MEYEDLYIFPEGHPPSPYDHPVLIFRSGKLGDGFLPKGLLLCAVGWLERPGYTTGQVSDECIDALVHAHANRIFMDGTRGIHDCTLCGQSMPQVHWRSQIIQLKGHGHYLVQIERTVFMAPELLLHYIHEHQYHPPQEFVEATIHGKFLMADDLDIKWRDKRASR